MYMLGGYYGACHSAHYRITATGSSWEGRAAYPRPIHRHLMVVDRVKQRLYVFGGNVKAVMINDVVRAFFETKATVWVCVELPEECLEEAGKGK